MPVGRPVQAGRLVPYLLAALAVAVSVTGLTVRPATAEPAATADYVVVAGAPGLRWDDVDPVRTPTLWRLASDGSIGWLSVRSAHRTTCPVDGWLTLGAGNYAVWNSERVRAQCPQDTPVLERPDRIGANLPGQRDVVRDNQRDQPYGAVPGALAESLRCTVAVGPGAAVASARPFGRVDRYEPALPANPAALLSSCVLSVVDLGTVSGEGSARRTAAARADAGLARLLVARPPRSLLLVAGLSDTDTSSRLHVAIADGPGWERGWLTSAGTARDGYLQLVDLAPTVLSALGRAVPERILAGRAAFRTPGRGADLTAAVAGVNDADRRARVQRGVTNVFLGALTAIEVILFLLVVPLMVRARRHAGPTGPAAPSRVLLGGVEVLLTAAALAIPAAMLAGAVPWWRTGAPGWTFVGVMVAFITIATAAIRLAPRYRRTLWPMGAIAVVGVVVVGADLLTGARLQLNGVVGYSAVEGSRYAGVGSVGLGVFVAGILITAGCLAQSVRRPWRPAVVVLLGGFAVIMVGSPYLGADPVGAIAVTAGVSVAAAISAGGWLTFARFAWAGLAGLAVTIGFAALDLRRPVIEQGSLGRFLTAFANGTGGPTVQRVATDNVNALLGSPLTLLAIAGALMLAFAQFSPWGGLNRLFGLHPAIRAAGAGITVAVLMAGVLGGAAFSVAGAAAAAMVPMAALTALRVLDHAADRTPPTSTVVESGPATAETGGATSAGATSAGDGPAGDGPPAVESQLADAVGEPVGAAEAEGLTARKP